MFDISEGGRGRRTWKKLRARMTLERQYVRLLLSTQHCYYQRSIIPKLPGLLSDIFFRWPCLGRTFHRKKEDGEGLSRELISVHYQYTIATPAADSLPRLRLLAGGQSQDMLRSFSARFFLMRRNPVLFPVDVHDVRLLELMPKDQVANATSSERSLSGIDIP